MLDQSNRKLALNRLVKHFLHAVLTTGIAALFASGISVQTAQATNLVADGGFEQQSIANRVGVGDFFVGDGCQLDVLFGGGQCRERAPWFANNRSVFLVKGGTESADGVNAAEGSYLARLGGNGQLSQFFVAPQSGDYTLSWLEAGGRQPTYSDPMDYFAFVFGGGRGYFSEHQAIQFQPFLQRQLPLAGLVGGTSYQLTFIGNGRCCSQGSLLLDDVRIEGSSAVPEPANWALMIAGFGLVGSAVRRRAKVRVAFA